MDSARVFWNLQTTPENRITAVAPSISPVEICRLIGASPLPAFVAGPDDLITSANDRFCTMLHLPQETIRGSRIDRFVKKVESEKDGINAVVRTANLPERADAELCDGREESLMAEIFVHRLEDGSAAVFAVDLSSRLAKQRVLLDAEKKKWQSHRIESLGRLAGGIAHDFNNFLAVLLLHVDILNLQLKQDDPIKARVREIRSVANSVAGTVRQLFAFGRKQPMTLAPCRLNPIVEGFAQHFDAGENIGIETDLSADLGMCFVDEVQILNVLQALAENARNAMPEGGTITIRTRNTILEHGEATPIQPAGQYVELTVSDTGSGMDAEAEDHIFEPFYKPSNSARASGLELAMVYGIVKQSKGFIWMRSRPGADTVFSLQFPRIDVGPSAEGEPSHAGGRTVLLVDDEAAVRRITAEFLQMSDHTVLQAGSGMEALEIAQSYKEPIHLLLTDFSMPLMDGRELAKKVAKLRPETAVLFMSGNIEPEEVGGTGTSEPVNFVCKPFSSAQLTNRVREVLEAADH